MYELTIKLTAEQYERVKDHPERVEQFLRYSPGSPTQPPPGQPTGFVDWPDE